jgi:signal transduction histidine kinase
LLNQTLRSSEQEVLSQRDSLAEKIRELADKNEEIENINSNLEKIVEMRTQALEDQNKRISEYSFINAHNLRGPLASILGLINLISKETDHENRLKLNHHLLKSAEALDDVVRSINRMLEKEFNEDINITQPRSEPTSQGEPKSNS